MATVAREHKRVDVRRNDTVKVITGRDKGKEGRVLRIFPNDGKVLVEHVMLVKKHVRPNPQRNVKGGIAEQVIAAARGIFTRVFHIDGERYPAGKQKAAGDRGFLIGGLLIGAQVEVCVRVP